MSRMSYSCFEEYIKEVLEFRGDLVATGQSTDEYFDILKEEFNHYIKENDLNAGFIAEDAEATT